ncbi:phosphoribosyltransferase family protein [Candidatus Coxiella mudrowiae]|uniref:phosphoribosyltransferase family protein n=1 Tax=Candidatus Coxiella mudrowiae TaxID=2054173 RepID=UPI001FD52190|nr:phosphoribosyltransferase family protein [Candidatus Coxiella mudrowiae]
MDAIASNDIVFLNKYISSKTPNFTRNNPKCKSRAGENSKRARFTFIVVTALLPISKDKIIILIDNGIATDATMQVAIKVLQELDCQRLIIATPVAPESTIQELSAEMDEVVLPRTPPSPFRYWQLV